MLLLLLLLLLLLPKAATRWRSVGDWMVGMVETTGPDPRLHRNTSEDYVNLYSVLCIRIQGP